MCWERVLVEGRCWGRLDVRVCMCGAQIFFKKSKYKQHRPTILRVGGGRLRVSDSHPNIMSSPLLVVLAKSGNQRQSTKEVPPRLRQNRQDGVGIQACVPAVARKKGVCNM